MAGPVDPIARWGEGQFRGMSRRLVDIGNRIDSLHKKSEAWLTTFEKGTKRAEKAVDDLGNAAERTVNKMTKTSRGMGGWKTVADKLGKSLLNLNGAILGLGFNVLLSGIKRVYELKERWAKATGELNKRMGALTPNMRTLSREANRWRGVVRGMTGDFEMGAAMFTDLAETLETTGDHVKEFSQLNLQLARGFNLGGRGAGELTKTFRSLGSTADGTSLTLAQLTKDAELLDVNSQQVVKELAEAGDMMARFGREGVKSLTQSAVYLKQFNIGMKDTRSLMDTFDRFDSAAETTARLNTIFGTTISSMDMLLSQDPAERIEKVRQELLAQGKTFEKLSYFERRSLAQSLNLGEKEVAFLLDRKKAHVSLAEFREKAAKKQADQAEAERRMQRQLQKTSQTLFDFGHAMDRITRAIGRALMPLLEALGLGIDKSNKFGENMKSTTDVIVKFFDALAASKEWQKLMQDLADALIAAARWVKNLKAAEITAFFDKAVWFGRLFVEHSTLIVGIWAGAKLAGALNNFLGVMGKAARFSGKLAGNFGRVLSAVTGIGSVSARATFAEGGPTTRWSTGEISEPGFRRMRAGPGPLPRAMGRAGGMLKRGVGALGRGLGAAAGMLGPIGMIVGVAGPLLASGIKKLFSSEGPGAKALREATEQLAEDRKRRTRESKADQAKMNLAKLEARRRSMEETDMRKNLMSGMRKQWRGRKELTEKERGALIHRVEVLQKLNPGSNRLEGALKRLKEGANLTRGQLIEVRDRSADYGVQLQTLRRRSKQLSDQMMLEAQIRSGGKVAEQQLKITEIQKKIAEAEKKKKEKMAEIEKKMRDELGPLPDFVKDRILDDNIVKAEQKRISDSWDDKIDKLKSKEIAATNELEALKRDNERETHLLELRNIMFQSRAFEEFATQAEKKGMTDIRDIQDAYLRIQSTGFGHDAARARMIIRELPRFAAGGVVTRPTRALIGEAGPEAVIPLRALAMGKQRQPRRFGGSVTKGLVNYAARGDQSTTGERMTVVAGDVYLDGEKVGRHLVRDMVANSSV